MASVTGAVHLVVCTRCGSYAPEVACLFWDERKHICLWCVGATQRQAEAAVRLRYADLHGHSAKCPDCDGLGVVEARDGMVSNCRACGGTGDR